MVGYVVCFRSLVFSVLISLVHSPSANFGFSLGINDVIPGPILREKKESLVEAAYAECLQLIQKAKLGKLENKPGCNQEQTLESMIVAVLSKVRGDVGAICMEELSRHNAPLIMATCGSKGALIRARHLSGANPNYAQQVQPSTSHKWLLASVNKLYPAIVYPMGSKIAPYRISRRNRKNHRPRDSFETASIQDS
jgi:hypothetical protein